MAKQSGLHQIKGKVGEYSYYKQTGVSGGLIRSINQGLSARVKTDEAYANTRLNNQEFGAAADVAALLGRTVNPKFRPMILPFSQSKMSKEILKVAREHAQNWGQRVVTGEDTARLCAILSAMSKRNASEFVTLGIVRDETLLAEVSASYTDEQATLMTSLGINALTITAVQYDLATGQWNPLAQEMATGYLYRKNGVSILNEDSVTAGTAFSSTEDLSVAEFIPEANHSGHQIVVFVVMPIRIVNSVAHVLQEYCSFWATPLPAEA